MISKRLPSSADELFRLRLVAAERGEQILRRRSRESSTPVKPDATMVAAVTPLRAPMPPKSNAFSTCSRSRSQ